MMRRVLTTNDLLVAGGIWMTLLAPIEARQNVIAGDSATKFRYPEVAILLSEEVLFERVSPCSAARSQFAPRLTHACLDFPNAGDFYSALAGDVSTGGCF